MLLNFSLNISEREPLYQDFYNIMDPYIWIFDSCPRTFFEEKKEPICAAHSYSPQFCPPPPTCEPFGTLHLNCSNFRKLHQIKEQLLYHAFSKA